VFVVASIFQPSQMFVSKKCSLPEWSTWKSASSLTRKHYTKPEKSARNKHSSFIEPALVAFAFSAKSD